MTMISLISTDKCLMPVFAGVWLRSWPGEVRSSTGPTGFLFVWLSRDDSFTNFHVSRHHKTCHKRGLGHTHCLPELTAPP